MRADLHVTHPLLLSHFNQNWNLSIHFRKFTNAKLYENPLGVSLVFSSGQTNIKEIIDAF
jgi:hypothetical protein